MPPPSRLKREKRGGQHPRLRDLNAGGGGAIGLEARLDVAAGTPEGSGQGGGPPPRDPERAPERGSTPTWAAFMPPPSGLEREPATAEGSKAVGSAMRHPRRALRARSSNVLAPVGEQAVRSMVG
jgi:hypothetical protein